MSTPIATAVPSSVLKINDSSKNTRPASAGFHPTIWGDYFLKYASESQEADNHTQKQVQRLKGEVKKMLSTTAIGSSQSIRLIDAIQRLGVSYHFENEIGEIMTQIKEMALDHRFQNDDLFSTSLKFRLLRQEGYNISSDIFKKFTNKEGKFKEEIISDVQGMLSLYEASHLMIHGEFILEEALDFTTVHLKPLTTESGNLNSFLAAQVTHALKQCIRKGIPRVEASHFISIYHQDPSHNEVLLKFAKLDFNIVQKLHQKELGDITRWWKDLGVRSNLPYVRDRVAECFLWIIGVYFEPKYELARRILVKVVLMASIIDDTYDAYGTIEELKLFTDAIERWDISSLDQLPDYMKYCYKRLLEVGDDIEGLMEKEGRGPYRVQYAKDFIKELTRAYLKEAEWLNQRYVPSVEEYMQTALVTCGYSMLSFTSLLGMGDIATEEAFEWFSNFPKIIRGASTVCRLMDDIVGHKVEQKRGHIASSVECYVNQHGVSEEEAYIELNKRVAEAWKDINEECLEPMAVPMPLLTRVLNLARVMDALYKEKDNYTFADGLMKDLIKTLFVDPIPV